MKSLLALLAVLPPSAPRVARGLFLATASLLFYGSSQAAVDVFLKLHDENGAVIKGDSLDKTFSGDQGWFAISSFSFGVENPTTIGSAIGGTGTGKVKFNEFTIRKQVDAVSPNLFKAVSAGKHFKYAKLALRKSSGVESSTAYLEYEFNIVFVTKQDWDTGGDEVAETVTFVYGATQISFKPQRADGTFDKPIVAHWSQITNTDTFDPVPVGN